jgi:hypothetical protein
LYAYCGNDPVNGVDPSGLKEPVYVKAEGWWRYVPFTQKLTWKRDKKEQKKIDDLIDRIIAARRLEDCVYKHRKELCEHGMTKEEVLAIEENCRLVERVCRAYIKAINDWTPNNSYACGPITFDFDAYENGMSTLKRLARAGMDGFNTGWPVGLSEGAGAGMATPARRATWEAAEEIAKLGNRSKQTIVLTETKQGGTIVSTGGSPLSKSQRALARKRGLIIAKSIDDLHGELTGLVYAGKRRLLPTVGYTNVKMCDDCFQQLSRIATESGYKFVLGSGRRRFWFVKL